MRTRLFPSAFRGLALLLGLIALVAGVPVARAAAEFVPGEVLVKYKPGVTEAQRGPIRARVAGMRLRSYTLIRLDHLKVGVGLSVNEAIRRLQQDANVEYAEPNYIVHADAIPNDPRFSELYGMRNTGQTGGTVDADIDADQAWDVFTGDPNLKVGVIDTGVDYNHPDLVNNVWTNPGEIPGNNIDDDNNGFVDDVHGYDFANNDGDPFDDNGHGSHCSGTIAGQGNNGVGVAGVNWQCKIVGIKFLNSAGSGTTAAAISSVQYAVTIGVKLTSNSWGGGGFSQALLDAINAAGAANQLFVAAAGNAGSNTDISPSYPASYDSPFILSVAATDHNDNLASFSNFGVVTVDLAAPGVDILSCQPGGGYQTLSGTSMATPHVAGVVALAWGRFPAMTAAQCKALVLNHVDPKPQLAGKVLTGGRLNALFTIADPDTLSPGGVEDLATTNPGSNTMDLTWTATGDDGETGRASSYDLRYSTSPINMGNFGSATPVPGAPSPQTSGSAESHRVTGLAFSTTYYFAIKALDEYGNPGPISNVAHRTTLGIPDVAASPDSFFADLLTGATTDQTLTLTNAAAGTLDFTIPTPVILSATPASNPYQPTGKEEADSRVGPPVVTGQGGPDGFGYRWVDSDESGGPAFGWVDITGVGTPLTLSGDDVLSAPVAIGFNFPFYGGSFGTLRVCSNGFLTFTDTGTPYGNQELPNAGGDANMLAPMWDDLNMTGAAAVYTHNDGSRFIVSWVNVPHYASSGSGTYTFEAILYPSGEIRYQYQSLVGDLNSATVGIQNAAKTVGLNVAFNTAYLHSNLAVRIFAIPQWLTVTPSSGRIAAGQSMNLNVHFDAVGLQGGNHLGQVTVLSNDPDENPLALQTRLHVIGAPDITVAPAGVGFDSVFIGAAPTRTVTVSNPGTDDLHVTGITSNHATVTAAPTSFTLAPTASQVVTITFSPVAVGPVSATLDIASDDPDSPIKTVTATGYGVTAPSFSVDPEQLDVTLNTNQTQNRTLRIENNGGSNYAFTAVAEADAPNVSQRDVDHDAEQLPKGVIDLRTGPATQSTGGPDAFGYTYRDSDAPGGPTFSWIDITGVGTPIPFTGDDQNVQNIPLPFPFTFYGTTFNSINAVTNGWLSFTSTITAYSNTTLPNTGTDVPGNLIAPWWDDQTFTTTGDAYTYYDGSKFIIEYYQAPHYATSGSGTYTYEVILHPSGVIEVQYLSMVGLLTSATVGIQNAARNDGLQVAFNAAYAHNNLALRFSPPSHYLTVSPGGGVVPPGGFVDLTVGFDATGLNGGDYDGQIRISGNDPVLPVKNVPCQLTVVGVPDILSAGALHFGNTFVGYPHLLQLTIQNTGSDVLHVSNIHSTDPAFGPDLTSVNVPPLASALVNVSFGPGAAQAYGAALQIDSDDPDSPQIAVSLDGTGLMPPDLQLDALSVNGALATTLGPRALTTTKPLVIRNLGGSNLTWSTSAEVSLGVPGTVTPKEPNPDKNAVSVPGDPVTESQGGPDAFGYRWIDSDQAGGPAFAWIDITGVGTPIPFTGDDQNVQNIVLPFPFTFYGNTYNSINAVTNGWLSFTSTLTTYDNTTLPNPSTSVPENLIAPWWDDQDFRTTGDAYTYYDGSKFVIEWFQSPHYSNSGSGTYTYEVILYPSGAIELQYLDMQGLVTSATIGVQNAARTIGLQVAQNAAYVHNGLKVRISRLPQWLTASPSSSTTVAGASDTIHVMMSAAGLEDGDYDGTVHVTTNDPSAGAQELAYHLHVGAQSVGLDLRPDDYRPQWVDGGWIQAEMATPNCAPGAVSVSSLQGNGGLGLAPGSSPAIASCNLDLEFTRMALLSAIPGGAAVQAQVSGEVPNVTWFLASETMRMLRPSLSVPAGPFTGGANVPVTWTDGAAVGATAYDLMASYDGGTTWFRLAQGNTSHAQTWSLPLAISTTNAYLELLAFDGGGYMGSAFSGPYSINAGTTGVDDALPARFGIRLAGKNPARGPARLDLAMPASGTADVRVYDLRGALVKELARGPFAAGRHALTWDGTRANGAPVAPGVYFVRARCGNADERVRVVMLD